METMLEGKAVLITGGGSGIGRATALAFAREGARVAIADVAAKGAEETVETITGDGGKAVFVRTDVAQSAQVQNMVRKTIEAYGRIDCAFNNAGISGRLFTRTADCDEETWDRVMAVNLKGVWLCMKYEIGPMLKQGGGAIVNTSSGAGLVGSRFAGSAYAASKHGILGLTKTAALEYARDGIRVNAVCPGTIRTPMGDDLFKGDPGREAQVADLLPIGRLGTPEEVASAVVWLCSEAASFVTGHAIAVDGGYVAQ